MVTIPQTNITVPSTPYNNQLNDVIKCVRQNINYTEPVYDPEKIKTRCQRSFLTYKKDDSWKQTLQRRSEQKSCGFFARSDRKYRECGNVELKTKYLVLKSLESIGNTFKNNANQKNNSIAWKTNDDCDLNVKDKSSASYSKIRRDRFIADNGITTIKHILSKAEKRITSIKAGQSLASYLEKEKLEKESDILANKNTSKKLDMILLNPTEKIPVTNSKKTEQSGKMSEVAGSTESRQNIKFLETLESLVMLFTMLSNMLQRDLRTKAPLSSDCLKTLLKHPIANDAPPPNPTNKLQLDVPTYQQRGPRRSIMMLGNTPLLQNNDFYNKVAPVYLRESASRASQMASPYNAQPRRGKNLQPRYKNSATFTPNGNKVETWEDLMNVDAGKGEDSTPDIDSSSRGGVSRISMHVGHIKFTQQAKKAPNATNTTDSIPPWQKIIQEQKDGNKSNNPCTKSEYYETKSERHNLLLGNLKSSFQDIKIQYANKLQEAISSKMDTYSKNFELLEVNHIHETDMKSVRMKINEWRKLATKTSARLPNWVQKLKQEQKRLGMENNENSKERLLKLFNHIDTKPSVFVKAKLCLLVFSLPLFQLCALKMQRALSFILKEFLGESVDYLKDWFQSRKILLTASD